MGLFVTFEGGEGAGKSSQIGRLRDALVRDGFDVLTTREPGGDAFAEGVRSLLLSGEMEARAELLLFLAARAQNTERVIRPHLAKGGVALCDRYVDSSVAYQGGARGLGRDAVAALNDFATGGLLPDLTFLLDLDPAVGLARQANKNRMERESLAFHRSVRAGFLAEAAKYPARFRVLDASASAAELHAKILADVREALRAGAAGRLGAEGGA